MNIDDIIIIKLIGAAGFWKLIESLIRYRAEKKKKNSEINNIHAQTNNLIVENWIEWSAKLENRVKELESALMELRAENNKKDTIIQHLTKKVSTLEVENLALVQANTELNATIKQLKTKQ